MTEDSRIKIHNFDKEFIGFGFNRIDVTQTNLKSSLITVDEEPYLAPLMELFKLEVRGKYKLETRENNLTMEHDSIDHRTDKTNPINTFNMGLQDCMVGRSTILLNFSGNTIFSSDSDNQGTPHPSIDIRAPLLGRKPSNTNSHSVSATTFFNNSNQEDGSVEEGRYYELRKKLNNKIVVFEIYHLPALHIENKESTLYKYLYDNNINLPNISLHLQKAYEFIKRKENNFRSEANKHSHVRLVFASIIDYDDLDALKDGQWLYLKSHELMLSSKGIYEDVVNPNKLIRDLSMSQVEQLISKGNIMMAIQDPYNELSSKYVNVLGKTIKIPVIKTKNKTDKAYLMIRYPDGEVTQHSADEIAELDFIFDTYEEAKNNIRTIDAMSADIEYKKLESKLKEYKAEDKRRNEEFERKKLEYARMDEERDREEKRREEEHQRKLREKDEDHQRKIREKEEEAKRREEDHQRRIKELEASFKRDEANHQLDLSSRYSKHYIDTDHMYRKNYYEHRSKDRDEFVETLKITAGVIGIVGTGLLLYNKFAK